MRRWVIAGAVLGFVAVATGAFGAHGLKSLDLPAKRIANWETASRYCMFHALALLATAWVAAQAPSRAAQVAGWAFLGGTLVFSGTLWALVLLDQGWLGAVTPLGGLGLLIGWAALAVAARRLPDPLEPSSDQGAT